MLDIKLIRDNPELVRAGMRRKGVSLEPLNQLLEVDQERRELQRITEQQQAELNQASAQLAKATSETRETMRGELRALSEAIKAQNTALEGLDQQFKILMRQIPNLPNTEVPDGVSDKENVVVRLEGQKPEFGFTPKDHEQLAKDLDLLDTERAVRLAGSKFYYLKNELVILEQAVLRYALDLVRQKGFNVLSVPYMAKAEAFYGVGHFSTPEDAQDGDAYQLERDGLYLIGTAEVGLINYHAGETVLEQELPLRYAGLSPAFRRESGTYGKETRGLYRVHQFNKVEMVSFTRPEDSAREHELLLSIAEELLQSLGLHYQVVLNCAGDLGFPQVKKWDIETWMPGMGKYGETHSCSNDTDYQARSLGIKYRLSGEENKKETKFLHTLNNTVIASPRILVALLENYQQADGSVLIPKVLQPYTGFTAIKRP